MLLGVTPDRLTPTTARVVRRAQAYCDQHGYRCLLEDLADDCYDAARPAAWRKVAAIYRRLQEVRAARCAVDSSEPSCMGPSYT